MANESILQNTEIFYTRQITEFGATPRGVNWKDEQSQYLRFDKLCQVIEQDAESLGSPFSVNDLGCGYGAMYSYLKTRYLSRCSFYNGYDISLSMIEKAKSAFGERTCKWIHDHRITEKADYTFASGVFNVKLTQDEKSWEPYIRDTLQDMCDASEKGFAFNMMTSHVDFVTEQLYYADPTEFFNYCKKRFSKKVSLLHDYPLWEWTIYVLKK